MPKARLPPIVGRESGNDLERSLVRIDLAELVFITIHDFAVLTKTNSSIVLNPMTDRRYNFVPIAFPMCITRPVVNVDKECKIAPDQDDP